MPFDDDIDFWIDETSWDNLFQFLYSVEFNAKDVKLAKKSSIERQFEFTL